MLRNMRNGYLVASLAIAGCGFQSPGPGDRLDWMDAGVGVIDGSLDEPPGAPGPNTTTLHPSADGWLRQEFPAEVHGSDPDLRTGSGSTLSRANRLVMAFDLSTIAASCQIASARLHLYYFGEGFSGISPTFEAHRITAAWSETSATWNLRSTGLSWAAMGGDFAPAAESSIVAGAGAFGWLSWDLTTLARAWLAGTTPNFGIEIVEPNDNPGNMGRKLFYSAQASDPALRPYVNVTCAPT